MQLTTAQRTASKLAGLTDLFASPLRVSHYLELVNPRWATHKQQARVVAVSDETADTRTLTLRPGRQWRRHRAGQHVRVTIATNGLQQTRTYSISSAPERDDGCITITVKAVPGGRVSQHLVRMVTPGMYVALGTPQGDLTLPEATPVRPLFITAGSGITPVMSMLRSYALRGGIADVTHLHYAPHAADVIFGEELEALARVHSGYRLTVVHTRTTSENDSRRNHFNTEQLDRVCPDWDRRDTYACGPQGLLTAIEEHWRQAGLDSQLHVERFHAAWADLAPDVGGGRVQFASSGVAVETDGRTNLLRLAEAAGLNPAHGCRMGICHSCDVRLVSGCVRDLRNAAVVDQPGAMIQLCVSAAAGNVAVDL